MSDRRQYTGTQRLQIGWTVLVLLFGVITPLLVPDWVFANLPVPVVLTGASVLWVLGLVLLGVRERHHWNAMVEHSSFDPERGTRQVDLETLVNGRSVVVTTDVRGLFAQAHTEIRTTIEGVDASFTIEMSYAGTDGRNEGLTTGNDTLDDAFIIEGAEQNVSKVLAPDVQAALMDVETAGTCTVTGDAVVYDVPFTRLSAHELETIASAVVTIAERIESIVDTE